MKKIVSTILVLVAMMMLLAGCGRELVKGDVSGKAYYDLVIHGDSTEMTSIGLSEEESKTILDKRKTELVAATKSTFTKSSLKVSDADINRIVEAELNVLKKLNGTAEVVSEDGDTQTVKISTNYVDIDEIANRASTETVTEVTNLQLTSESEIEAKVIEVYINKLVEYLNQAQVSTDSHETSFTFNKELVDCNGKVKQVYTPEDPQAFGAKVVEISSKK